MTPYFAFALIILFALSAALGGLTAAFLLADKPHPAPLFAAAITDTSLRRLQTTQFASMDVVQMQGIATALMDIGRSPSPNPYPPGSQARAVWFGGYVMAQARANQQATPQHAGDRT